MIFSRQNMKTLNSKYPKNILNYVSFCCCSKAAFFYFEYEGFVSNPTTKLFRNMSYLLMKNVCTVCTYCICSLSPENAYVSSSFFSFLIIPPFDANIHMAWSMMLFESLTNNNISSFGECSLYILSLWKNHGKMTDNNLFILFSIR